MGLVCSLWREQPNRAEFLQRLFVSGQRELAANPLATCIELHRALQLRRADHS
jgi:hypothetical protein